MDDASGHKLYILIADWVSPGHATCSAAHGAMMALDAWRGDPIFDGWKKESFKKFTCSMTSRDMDIAKAILDNNGVKYIDVFESNLDSRHTLTVVFPIDVSKREFKGFRYFRPYK